MKQYNYLLNIFLFKLTVYETKVAFSHKTKKSSKSLSESFLCFCLISDSNSEKAADKFLLK